MSKFSHGANDDADARAMTIPRRFLRKQPSEKCHIRLILLQLFPED